MENRTAHRLCIVCCTAAQIGLACLLLNSLSTIDNWSAVYAEDSKGYLLAADFFRGIAVDDHDTALMRYRLFSPVIPFAAAQLGRIIDIRFAFVGINIFLWFATALVFYELLRRLLLSGLSACAGAVLFTTSLPVAQWGMPIMVDMGAYFFAALVPLLCRGRGKGQGLPSAVFCGLLAAVAVLTKPTLVFLLVFLAVRDIVERKPSRALITCASALLCIGGTYALLGLSVREFSMYGAPRHRGLFYFCSAAFFCFHWGWIFFFDGCRYRTGGRRFCLAYLVSWLVLFVPFIHNPRLFFVCFPAVIPPVVYSLRKRCPDVRVLVLITAAYVCTSNCLTALHLYVMRTLAVREPGALLEMLFALLGHR